MESLHPVDLGAVIFFSLIIAAVARPFFQKRLVLVADASLQPRRQFWLDFFLLLGAALIAAGYNFVKLGFPPPSGVKLLIGFIVLGFFFAMDMALARERTNIQNAKSKGKAALPAENLYPMTRKLSMVAFVTAVGVTVVLGLVIAQDLKWVTQMEPGAGSLSDAAWSIMMELAFVMGMLLFLVGLLIVSFAKNLKLLFHNETGVLERVSKGDLSRLVPVSTRDEFGFIANYTNEMIHGLRDRTRLLTSLKVAEEVQKSLLPQKPFSAPGLDIFGKSIYCDETGGDYFDYLRLPGGRVGVAVADASDHGVGSALYMTTVRAFLRFGSRNYQGPDKLTSDVNQRLCQDSGESGRFMTLFFMEIDPNRRILSWVRAGHEPALFFDPGKDEFTELEGQGVALGVLDNAVYQANEKKGWKAGSIILAATDGIREARNADGEMFGLNRVKNAVRKASAGSAKDIVNEILEELAAFQKGFPGEDDVTIVAVKLLENK